MKPISSLAEETARVELAATTLVGIGNDPRSQYLALEEISIQVLDGSFDSYPEGVLAAYLESYLFMRRLAYGLIPFTNPMEK
jgi:hypothetical protein